MAGRGSAGGAIPERARAELEGRLRKHAAKHWKGRWEPRVKFKGRHAYVGARSANGLGEVDEVQLCRLEWHGSPEVWGFAFYKYSDSRYEVSILPDGSWEGPPEAAWDCAGMVYLQ